MNGNINNGASSAESYVEYKKAILGIKHSYEVLDKVTSMRRKNNNYENDHKFSRYSIFVRKNRKKLFNKKINKNMFKD